MSPSCPYFYTFPVVADIVADDPISQSLLITANPAASLPEQTQQVQNLPPASEDPIVSPSLGSNQGASASASASAGGVQGTMVGIDRDSAASLVQPGNIFNTTNRLFPLGVTVIIIGGECCYSVSPPLLPHLCIIHVFCYKRRKRSPLSPHSLQPFDHPLIIPQVFCASHSRLSYFSNSPAAPKPNAASAVDLLFPLSHLTEVSREDRAFPRLSVVSDLIPPNP